MSSKKFVAYAGHGNRITVLQIEKETDASVWVNGRRSAKRSSYENYFDTWQEAHDFLRDAAEEGLAQAKRRVDSARSRLEEVKKLKPIT